MESWHSYPKVHALGHNAIDGIFEDTVIVEEKIDGSQFSCGRFDGELRCRSKGAVLQILAPEKMFEKAVEVAGSLPLTEGWTYRFEYLAKPKHNSLAYNRTPVNYLIGFDVNTGHEKYMGYAEKKAEFDRLGLETVPLVHSGTIGGYGVFRQFLESESVLGGQKIEGVVVKNYAKFGRDGKALIGKFVSEAFKEVHSATWRTENPSGKDFLGQLIEEYSSPARWNKSIFRLRDEGKLENSPRDIGLLIREAQNDVLAECKEEIAAKLFEYAWKHIGRGVTRGLPEHYKEHLLKSSFRE